MYARVAYYRFNPGMGAVVADRVREGLLPVYMRFPGFRSFALVLVSDDTGYSLSTWTMPGQATEAALLAAEWVRDNIADMVELSREHVGRIVCAVTAPDCSPVG